MQGATSSLDIGRAAARPTGGAVEYVLTWGYRSARPLDGRRSPDGKGWQVLRRHHDGWLTENVDHDLAIGLWVSAGTPVLDHHGVRAALRLREEDILRSEWSRAYRPVTSLMRAASAGSYAVPSSYRTSWCQGSADAGLIVTHETQL